MKLTRRQFGKIVLASAGATAVGITHGPQPTLAQGTGYHNHLHRAQPTLAQGTGYHNRLHGPVLTATETLQEFEQHVRAGGHTIKKVVTTWGGWAKKGEDIWHWNTDTRNHVCHTIPGELIVRTTRGDGYYLGSDEPEWAFPLPDEIEAEIQPWYDIKSDIWIQIGNEPNNHYDGNVFFTERKNDQRFIDEWAGHLDAAIMRCKERFPLAKIITSPLASIVDPTRYFDAMQNLPNLTNDIYIGFNTLTSNSFRDSAEHGMYRPMVAHMQNYFGDRQWFITEYGIHDNKTGADKGRLYAEMMHFDGGDPSLPNNVVGGVYFHVMTDESEGGREPSYHIGIEGANAYRERIGPGSFSSLSASMTVGGGMDRAEFWFEYAGASRWFIVEASTLPDMSWDVYLGFGEGDRNPVVVTNPTKWDKFSLGRTLYWQIIDEWGVRSPIQATTIVSGGT